jgi:ATP-dependent DNA ligase
MLIGRNTEPFDHPEFIFEPKYDGFRAMAVIRNGECTLLNGRF